MESIMSLTTKQWEDVKKELYHHGGQVTFTHNGCKLTVSKSQQGESNLAIWVFIDGVSNGGWGVPHAKDAYSPDKVKYLCPRHYPKYKASDIKRAIKALGKRRAMKEYPELHNKNTLHSNYFDSFRTFKSVYKKLDDLTVVKIGIDVVEQALVAINKTLKGVTP